MPYKANEARRHKIPRARYKVRNWPEYDMCGRPLRSKRNLQERCGTWSGADMCAAFDAAHTPRAQMGVRRSGPIQAHALEALDGVDAPRRHQRARVGVLEPTPGGVHEPSEHRRPRSRQIHLSAPWG